MATIKNKNRQEIKYRQIDTNPRRKKNDITPPLVGLTTDLACNAQGAGKAFFQRNSSSKDLAETCNRQGCNPPSPCKTLSECCERVTMLYTRIPRPQFHANPPFLSIDVF